MRHRFAVLTAILTFPLIFAGATVTTKDAALSVPDWPLSYGGFFPKMVGNIRFEHGHRLIAAFVGLLTLILAIWFQGAEPRRWVRLLSWSALGAVLVQGLLGGLTVLNLRPPAVSAIHGCLAQAFFCLLAVLALVTSPGWIRGEREGAVPGRGLTARQGKFLPIALVSVVYGQVILGAIVRHRRAWLAIPDFPLMFGGLFPSGEKLQDPDVLAQLLHRAGALLVSVVVIVAGVRAIRSGASSLRAPAVALLSLLPVQILLGAATIWSGRDFFPATAHVAGGALTLVASVILAIRSLELARGAGAPGILSFPGAPVSSGLGKPGGGQREREATA